MAAMIIIDPLTVVAAGCRSAAARPGRSLGLVTDWQAQKGPDETQAQSAGRAALTGSPGVT